MSRYTSATDADRQEMLDAIGVESIDDLFADVPEGVRLGRALDLPQGKPEQEVYAHLRDLAAKNVSAEDELSFLGAGMYDHYVPALIDSILSRSEFLTPYTPYQPEISQGGLQVMFEYQTAISELTGLPVSNASVYEGPSAVAAAGWLAHTHTKKTRFLVSRRPAPALARDARDDPRRLGHDDRDHLAQERPHRPRARCGDDVAAIFVGQPNFYGAIEDLEALSPIAQGTGALLIVQADPLTLGVLRPPGDFDVDICVGEGQTLGNRLDFGGPSFGFFAAQQAYLRRMPGRIAGETTDVDGRRGFVLTLQTREQHIRREKATHNICTAQALNALAGVIYLSWLGRAGHRRAGRAARLAHGLRPRDAGRDRRRRAARHDQPVVREFALELDAPTSHDVIEFCAERGVNPGYPRRRTTCLLVAITEQRSKADIDRLAEVLERRDRGRARSSHRLTVARPHDELAITENRLHADPAIEGHELHPQRSAIIETAMQRDRAVTIYEKSSPGRRAFVAPELDVAQADELPERVPPRGAAEAAGDRRAGDRPPLQPALEAQLRSRHGLLPARFVHDEAQPEAARARRGAAGQLAAAPAAVTRSVPRVRWS